MAGVDDLTMAISGAVIDPSGPVGTFDRLAEQVALILVEDIKSEDNDDSVARSDLKTIESHGDEKLEEGNIQEVKSDDRMEP